MKKTLLLFVFTLTANIVMAQGNDIVIVEHAESQTAYATFRVDKNGKRISNSYSGDVVIPEKSTSGYPVTTINHQTFEGCIDLTSVKIPKTVKFIDYDAFRNSSLKEITIPASVDSISEGVFFEMKSLKKIVFEDGSSVLHFACGREYGGEGQFSYKHQSIIEEVYIGRTYTTTWGKDGSLVSPLFKGNETLKKVTFGDYVKKINEQDFYSCKALVTVDFGSGIETIGKDAFNQCTSLSAINLPNSVKFVESYAFKGCAAAKTLILSNSLKLLSWGIFEDCKSVAEISIPASIDSISERVFFGMEQLKKVTIEDSPSLLRFAPGQEYGGEGQFSFKHQAIEEAYIGRTYITTWGKDGSLDSPLFKMSETLKKVTFGDYVKTINANDFIRCSKLETVIFGKGIETIGKAAFSNCEKLTAINLSDGLLKIESEAFINCNAASTLTLPQTLKQIGWGAFKNCKGVTELTIPASVEEIADEAFLGMESLTNVTIADGTTTLKVGYGQQYGGESMFKRQPITEAYVGRNCASDAELFRQNKTITKITFGDACTEIPDFWLQYCDELKEVYCGRNIVRIGTRAFRDCGKLSSFYSYNTIKTIADGAFYSCESAQGWNFSDCPLETIGEDAFAHNNSISSLSLPATLKSIAAGGFYNCKALKSITCMATVPPTCGKNTFYKVDTKECKLYVPDGCVDAYKAADTWKDFFNIETGIKDIQTNAPTVVDSYLFNGQRSSSVRKGLNIIRTKDGQTRKVIVR